MSMRERIGDWRRWIPGGRWAVIVPPYVWMLVFFAIPFLIVLKISFSRMAIAMPPYTPLLEYVHSSFSVQLNLGNYLSLLGDDQYVTDSCLDSTAPRTRNARTPTAVCTAALQSPSG